MPDKLPHCLIRVDGTELMGTGHIMRCLALAGELKNCGNKVSFLSALCPPLLKKRLEEEGHEVAILPAEVEPGSKVDAKLCTRHAAEKGASLIIVDGYHFLTPYQRLIMSAGLEQLYIDDLAHCQYYCADFVLNQNPSATTAAYPNCESHTNFLLGQDYVLLRNEFVKHKKSHPARETAVVAKKILVTMGGSDIRNATGMVMEALGQSEAGLCLDVTVVVGGGNAHAALLAQSASDLNRQCAHTFATVVDAKNMPALIAESDLIISAGGTTVWEAAYLAGATAVIITADNQEAGMENFARRGAIMLLGKQQNLTADVLSKPLASLIKDQATRASLSYTASLAIDGKGARRVVQKLNGQTI